MPILAAFALAKRVGTAVITWLKHASFWQIVSIGLACFALVQHFQLAGERRHSHKVELQLRKATETLDRLSKESAAKQKQVTKTITRYVTVDKPKAEREAERIDRAALPGQCKTPGEVLQADI